MALQPENQLGTGVLPNSSVYPNMADGVDGSTYRPYSLAESDVENGLRLDAINTELMERATLSDIYASSVENVIHNMGDEMTIPDAIVTKMTAPAGSRTITVPITDPLRGTPRAGDDRQSGFEIGQRLRYMTAHYNEYSQAVVVKTFGKDYNDLEGHFKLFSKATPQLSKYFKELDGRQFREAALETYSSELCKDNGLRQHWNPNVFVANTDPFSQPTYDTDLAVYTNKIADAMEAAATGTNGEYANISAEFCEAVLEHAEVTLRIEPLSIGGEDRYVIVLPSNQYAKMTSLAGEFGTMWVDKSALTTDEQTFPGVMGRYKKLLFVSDSRYPTVSLGGSAGSYTLTPTYVQPGNEDERNRRVYDATSNKTWSVGMLYGKGAFLDWTVKSLHFEDEIREYNKEKGIGAFTERGIQLGLIRTDKAATYSDTDGSYSVPTYVENTGSIALFFTNTSTLTIRS